jgi:hypothetical protein
MVVVVTPALLLLFLLFFEERPGVASVGARLVLQGGYCPEGQLPDWPGGY